MKEIILEFAEAETEGSEFFLEWIKEFKLEEISKDDVFELVNMFELSNGRPKLAFIDLFRLLLSYEKPAGHVLYNHWEELEAHIFQQFYCLDTEDPEDKELHKYHLVSLRMVGNLHST